MEICLILFKIKARLKLAMMEEIEIRKNKASGDFIVSQQGRLDYAVAQKTVARSIISMFPEIGKKPEAATDDDCIKLLKKYISQEKERQLYIDRHITESDIEGITATELKKLVNSKLTELGDKLTSVKIKIAKEYLPIEASESEVIKWINENLDLAKFKNKMQAMSPIMKNFKGCDGNIVKGILLKM